jgi:hypothetical protein
VGLELVLRDVTVKQTLPQVPQAADPGADPAAPPKLPSAVEIKAEKVTYRDCDFENPVPRHCQGAMYGVTFGADTQEWRELTAKLEELAGKPAIFDVVSESSYEPKAERRFSTQAKITWRDFGAVDVAVSGDGVDFDALVEKMRAALPTLETGGEEARTAFAIGLMGDVSNLRLAGMSVELSGSPALEKLLGAAFGGMSGQETHATPAERLAKFDEIVQKLKDGPTTQAAATFLSDPGVREFIEKPVSLAVKVAPEAPITVMSFGMKLMGGLQALAELKLKMIANGKDLPLEPLIAASAAMMMSGGGGADSEVPLDEEGFDPEALEDLESPEMPDAPATPESDAPAPDDGKDQFDL